MKRITVLIALGILCGIVSAQQPAKPAKPDAISEVLKAEADASAAFDAAKARYEAAQANTRAVLFREMGEAGVKPSECAVVDAQGNSNPFACISRDPKTGAWAFKKIEKSAETAQTPTVNKKP